MSAPSSQTQLLRSAAFFFALFVSSAVTVRVPQLIPRVSKRLPLSGPHELTRAACTAHLLHRQEVPRTPEHGRRGLRPPPVLTVPRLDDRSRDPYRLRGVRQRCHGRPGWSLDRCLCLPRLVRPLPLLSQSHPPPSCLRTMTSAMTAIYIPTYDLCCHSTGH